MLDMVTADRYSNQASVFLGKGDGSFSASNSFATGSCPTSVTLGDLNGDNVLDMVTADWGSNQASVFLANTTKTPTILELDLETREGALSAMGTINDTLQRISSELGAIGSVQSRLSVTLNTLSVSRENFSAAAGRITDADMAQESADLVKRQILQQAASSVLAQANQQPALALTLLRG